MTISLPSRATAFSSFTTKRRWSVILKSEQSLRPFFPFKWGWAGECWQPGKKYSICFRADHSAFFSRDNGAGLQDTLSCDLDLYGRDCILFRRARRIATSEGKREFQKRFCVGSCLLLTYPYAWLLDWLIDYVFAVKFSYFSSFISDFLLKDIV